MEPRRPPALIDAYMPTYDVRERHTTRVRALVMPTYEALRQADLVAPLLVRALFTLRVLPSRLGRPRPRIRMRTLEDLVGSGALLGEDPGREIAFGLIGKFWALRTRSHRLVSPATFRGFDEPGFAKSVISFAVEPIDASTTLLSTETRVACTDAASRRTFGMYWALIGPFSGLIRIVWLRAIRTAAEGGSPAR